MRKKKVVIHSNHSKSKSGFGRHTKALLTYLHQTGKYDLVEYCTGLNWSNPSLSKMPWLAFGTNPDSQPEWQRLLQGLNPNDQHIKAREISYGAYNIDRLMREQKPDVYIGIEDIWAFNGYTDRKWWSKIHPVIHTTLDSLPILTDAVEVAPKIKDYYVWAKFAETAMAKIGHTHVKTIHGAIEANKFFRLQDDKRLELRKRFGIPSDAFIIGFVFRNQLRKSVVKLLQGFKDFCKNNPQSKAYLLLHTHWSEGWNIPERIREVGVDPARVLTTYICRNCRQYEIKPFQLPAEEWKKPRINIEKGQNIKCRFCGSENGQITTNPTDGVTENDLNEVYNLMDVYCHPFTSGGQEMPLQEAKLTELITLTTNYACGEEYCTPESGGLPLDWSEYREQGTEFIKASTSEYSISKQLQKVFNMKPARRKEMGEIARKFVLDGFDISIVGKQFEDIIDNAPFSDWDWNFAEPKKNPDYVPPDIEDDKEWVKDLYKNILNMYVKDDDTGLADWVADLQAKRRDRNGVYDYFREVALKENHENNKIDLRDLFDDNGKKKVLLVIKESVGDCFIVSSLFKSLKEQYPQHDLYVGCEQKYADIFLGNPYVYKTIPYHPAMESELTMIGQGEAKAIVDVFLHPAIASQRQLSYLSHDRIALDLDSTELKLTQTSKSETYVK